MVASISEFRSELATRGVSRPYLFQAEFSLPDGLEDPGNTQNLISLWCHSIQTPNTTLFTDDNFLENGIRRKSVYEYDVQNVSCQFFVDSDYKTKRIFDAWHKMVVSHRRHFAYPDDYTADKLILNIIDLRGNVVYRYTYNRVFPKTIGSIEMNYSFGGQVSSFNVEFVFSTVEYKSYSLESSGSSQNETEMNNDVGAQLIENEEVLQDLGITFDAMGNVESSYSW